MQSTIFQWRSLNTRITLYTLAIFLVSIWSLALYTIHTLREDMQGLLGEQQFATVTVVAAQVDSELKNHLNALQRVADMIDAPKLEKPQVLQQFLDQRPVLQSLFNAGIFAARRDGTAIANVPHYSGRGGVDFLDTQVIAAAIEEGKWTISRPTPGRTSKHPMFGMAVPIRDAQGRVIGALCGMIDLGLPNFLDQITEGRYGKTGGYFLLAPQYRLIVTATDRSRIMETYADQGINPTVDRLTQGFEGSLVYVNLLGVEILASAKRIPVANWQMVASLPTAEAFAPVRAMQRRMLLATICLTLLAGALSWWIVRRELRPLLTAARALETMPNASQPLLPLSIHRQDEIGQVIGGFNRLLETLVQREDALKKSESFKDAILNSVAAEIVVLDRDGSIQVVNERWRQFSLENGSEVGTPIPRTDVGANYLAVCAADGDSTPHCGLSAGRGIQAVIDGRQPSFSLEYPCDSPRQQRWFSMIVMPLGPDAEHGVAITHTDITALKQAQQALAESKELLTLFIQYAPAGLAMFDRDMRYLYASSRWLADYGLGERALQGISHYEVFPEISAEWKEAHRRGLDGEVLRSEGERFTRLDGSEQWVRWEIRPWYNAGRSIGGIVIFTEDITANKNAEAALQENEERLRFALQQSQMGGWDLDLVDHTAYRTVEHDRIFGYESLLPQWTYELFLEHVVPEDRAEVDRLFQEAIAALKNWSFECRIRRNDGVVRWIRASGGYRYDSRGAAIRMAGIVQDITERHQMEDALREQEEFFRLLAENLEGFVTVLDVDGRRLYNSPSYARLLGERDLCGTSSFLDVHPADRERVVAAFRETVASGIGQQLEYRFVVADGSSCLLESRSGVIKDQQGHTKRVVVVSHDVTERRRTEERIHHLAFHDGLTQLPNRLTLTDRLRQAMATSKRSGCYGALMFLDLDNFKPLNDAHGHEAGDLLLIEAAARLRSCIREMDTVARFGGDEFVVLLSELHADKTESTSQARRVAEKIRRALSQPFLLTVEREGRAATSIEHYCTASIGVALFRDHEASQDEILKSADAAMYRAKEAGRNTLRFIEVKA